MIHINSLTGELLKIEPECNFMLSSVSLSESCFLSPGYIQINRSFSRPAKDVQCSRSVSDSVYLQADVMALVQLMGGRVYRDLNVSVTHLVAGEVGSKKYLVAASLGKPIVLPTWVKTCWEKSQNR